MNETQQPLDYEDPDWRQAEQIRDEAFRRNDVEDAFRRLNLEWLSGRGEGRASDWKLLAEVIDERFPGFLKFYRSL